MERQMSTRVTHELLTEAETMRALAAIDAIEILG